MKIIIDILHPAHVHFFKNFVKEMEKKGHEILVTARVKDIALNLLKLHNIKYIKISKMGKGFFGLLFELIKRDYRFYKMAKKFRPDLMMGLMGATIATAGIFLKAKSIVFWDTENSRLSNAIVYSLVNVVCTPRCYEGKVIGNHITYNGYHELAYLHPKRFKPDKRILKKLNLKGKDKFFILRFISWQAAHDFSHRGFTNTIEFVKELEKYGKVLITSEAKLPKELEKYKIKLPCHKIHDLLALSTMYIGESATMASEAAILGTPAIFVSTSKRGYTNEQEKKYGLVFNFSDQEPAMRKTLELLKKKNLKKEWEKKRDVMLKDKIDVTKWVVNFVENYYRNEIQK